MAAKAKAMAAADSSQHHDEDINMLDPEFKHEDSEHEDKDPAEPMEDVEEGPAEGSENVPNEHIGDDEGDGDGDDQDEDQGNHDDDGSPRQGGSMPGGLDEAAMAIFGNYRQFGWCMLSLSSRLKTMLNNIKSTADPTTRLVTLQD